MIAGTVYLMVEYMDGGIIRISYTHDQSWLIENIVLVDVFDWCDENLSDSHVSDGGYHMGDHMCYKYIHTKCEEDVMAFKLMWS